MSMAERTVWITLVTTPLVAAVYLAVIVSRAWSTPVEEVSWAVPMIWAIGAIGVAVVVVTVTAAIATEVSSEVQVAVQDAVRAEVVAELAGELSPEASAEVAAAAGKAKATRHRMVEADERDKLIERLGNYRAGLVVSLGALVGIILTMLELDHFWIAHTLFGAIVLGSLYGGIGKVIAYRRGL